MTQLNVREVCLAGQQGGSACAPRIRLGSVALRPSILQTHVHDLPALGQEGKLYMLQNEGGTRHSDYPTS